MIYAIQAFARQQSFSWQVDAVDADDARRQAEAHGYVVLEVAPLRASWSSRFGRSAAAFPLLPFNQSLLILIRAGLSVVESIEVLAERESRPESRTVLLRLHEHLATGLSLSNALERQTEVFPALYIAGVRANERSGGLAESIERFILYRSQADLMRKRIVGAAIYPALTLGVGGLVIVFLMLYVVPRFSVVFADMGDRIPLMSRLLLDWGRFVHAHGYEVLAALIAGIAALVYALRLAPVRATLFRAVQRLPRIGEHIRTYQLARFYRSLGLLQQAGIPIVSALDLVSGLLPISLQDNLGTARNAIREGRAVSDAFEANGLTTAVSLRLLRVAERTGQMGDMLERSAVFHEEDVAQAIDWFVRLFEPLLMMAVGIVIGVVVMLMYAPIFELAGSLQ
ncbi:MAG: type II secretion system F family protein [Leptothrix sp. (in: b-proteobacteria)]